MIGPIKKASKVSPILICGRNGYLNKQIGNIIEFDGMLNRNSQALPGLGRERGNSSEEARDQVLFEMKGDIRRILSKAKDAAEERGELRSLLEGLHRMLEVGNAAHGSAYIQEQEFAVLTGSVSICARFRSGHHGVTWGEWNEWPTGARRPRGQRHQGEPIYDGVKGNAGSV